GVKADLVQRLKSYSNTLASRTRNSNSPNIREEEGYVDDMNSDVEQHVTGIKTRNESVEIKALRDLPASSVIRQELNNQPYRDTIRTKKQQLPEDMNDNHSDSLQKLVLAKFENLENVIADFDYKLNTVVAQ
ncbi:4017_t:CDS:2, partial [Racocetra persica]